METKQCKQCGQIKLVSEFNKNNKKKGYLQPQCRQCQADYYRKHRDRILPQTRIRNDAAKTRTRQWIWDYLKAHPCVDCGETNPLVLEFDHREGESKEFDVSKGAYRSGYALWRIEAEVGKCDVRCANCHRIKTAAKKGWYADISK